MKKVLKEILLLVLLLSVIVVTIGILFYEDIPNNKLVPEPVSYSVDSTTTALIQEIADSTVLTTNGEAGEEESILKSYSVGISELSTAASKQSYTSGKTDPFAEYTETENSETTTDENGNVVSSESETNSTSVDTNSTGTFFESSSSK